MKCALTLALSAFLFLPAVTAQQSATSTSPSSTSAGADEPAAPHEDGIYLLSYGPDGSVRLTKLQSNKPKIKANLGKAFLAGALTYGIKKTHGQAVLEGANAKIATDESGPVFYAYNQPVASLKLAKFSVKNQRREINVFASNAYGATMGEDAKSLIAFRSEELKPGILKLTPLNALLVGEYVFHQAGRWDLVFDFGVSLKTAVER